MILENLERVQDSLELWKPVSELSPAISEISQTTSDEVFQFQN